MIAAEGGFQVASIVNWFKWPSRFWAVGPQRAQTLFDGGQRRAQVEILQAADDATIVSYRSTVIKKGGLVTYLEVIAAQSIALSNECTEVNLMRQRMDASVQLVRALGGGWDVTKLPK